MRRRTPEPGNPGILSYIIPLAIAGIVLFLLAHAFLSGDAADDAANGSSYALVTPTLSDAEVYVYMSGDSRKQITGETKLFATDSKLEVESGQARVSVPGTAESLLLDRNSELRYTGSEGGRETFALRNANAWVETENASLAIALDAYTVFPDAGSVIALNQNTRASNLYVLQGSASVMSSDAAIRSDVGVGQQLTVVLNEMDTLSEFDSLIEPVDDFFRSSEWFLQNNGNEYLTRGDSAGEDTDSDDGSGASSSRSGFVVFLTPRDEQTVETETLDITGTVTSDRVAKITINDREAALDDGDRSFVYKAFELSDSVNNIVYKTFDAQNDLLSKGVITVYRAGSRGTSQDAPTVTTYPISDEEFPIVSPADNPHRTSESVVRIDGRVASGVVEYITVNGYRLTSFSPQGTTWHYFANKQFGTMNEGINLYNIRYYDESDELIAENLYTIVKETQTTQDETDTEIEGDLDSDSDESETPPEA